MGYKSDIEIAQSTIMQPITEVAEKIGLSNDDIELYGKYKSKINLDVLTKNSAHQGKLILVTAMSPTPAGEGKTTTTVGLADGLNKIGKNSY